jgi:hypothetical protein
VGDGDERPRPVDQFGDDLGDRESLPRRVIGHLHPVELAELRLFQVHDHVHSFDF